MDATSYLLGKKSSGGGGGTPKTIDELNTNYVTPFFDYLFNTPSSFDAYTTDRVTLYTPNANYKNYIIYKRGIYYRVVWTKTNVGNYYKSTNGTISNLIVKNYYSTDTSLWDKKVLFNGSSYDGYRTNDLTSIEACISAIQNPSTSYTKVSSALSDVSLYNEHSVIISNTFIVEDFNDIQTIATPLILSKNETIEVKS